MEAGLGGGGLTEATAHERYVQLHLNLLASLESVLSYVKGCCLTVLNSDISHTSTIAKVRSEVHEELRCFMKFYDVL